MSLTRASLVTLRKAVSNAARRQASTASEQTFRSNPVADEGYMFKPATWFRYYETLPLLVCTGFAGAICAGYIFYSFFKEDVNVNNASKLASYEAFHNDHRYKIINLHKNKPLPDEIAELKKQLGPYERK